MTIPDDNFDWVNANAEWSLEAAVRDLYKGVAADVEKRLKLDKVRFMLEEPSGGFAVSRQPTGGRGPDRVRFVVEGNAIHIVGPDNVPDFHATPILNQLGQRRFAGEELQPWQVRRRALEKLFFP